MTESVLDLLKFVLLALLYLFFARVLWAVWSEVRAPRATNAATLERRDPIVADTGDGTPASGNAIITARPSKRRRTTADDTRVETPKPDRATKRAAKRAAKSERASGRVTRLVVIEPKGHRGTTWVLDGEITIGRSPNCTITVGDDTFVSGLHARIFDHDGQAMVEDLGSTNGSFHNGAPLTGMRLLHRGDRVQIGSTILEAQ